MSKNFHIERLDTVLVIRLIEPCSVDDILEAIDEVAAYPASYARLWDISVGVDFDNDELKEIAGYGKQRLDYPARVAIVAPGDLSFGLMRVFEVYREKEDLEFRVFRDEAQALVWLREDTH